MISRLLQYIIRLYQRTLSPDHGWFRGKHPHGFCRFYPTCSQYTHDAIDQHGAIQGVWLGAKRIIRCNPWHEPGYDPVPHKHST